MTGMTVAGAELATSKKKLITPEINNSLGCDKYGI